ncbi:MAG: N-acetylmuramoyl-L-alanine amidase, partial [Tabrizicola sp.]
MTALRPLLALMMLVLTLAGPAAVAEDLSALAKVNPLRSGIVARGDGGLELKVALSQPVPWRLRLMDNPPRLVIDAREIDWRGVEALAVVRP